MEKNSSKRNKSGNLLSICSLGKTRSNVGWAIGSSMIICILNYYTIIFPKQHIYYTWSSAPPRGSTRNLPWNSCYIPFSGNFFKTNFGTCFASTSKHYINKVHFVLHIRIMKLSRNVVMHIKVQKCMWWWNNLVINGHLLKWCCKDSNVAAF